MRDNMFDEMVDTAASATFPSATRPQFANQNAVPAAIGALIYPSRAMSEIDVWHDPELRAIWCMARATSGPHYSPAMLDELILATNEVRGYMDGLADDDLKPLFWITGSNLKNVFRLGGDLDIFLACMRDGDAVGLRTYAIACIRAIHNSIINFNAPLVSIGLMEGDALGGGFECALTFNFLVAEKHARFGFPEILFNSFPGMGAYSLLSRKLGGQKAQEMIRSGRIYSALELQEIGLVDRVVENGEGRAAVKELIRECSGKHAALNGLNRVRMAVAPIPFSELEQVVDIWVETMMNLNRRDRRKMELLLSAQKKMETQAVAARA